MKHFIIGLFVAVVFSAIINVSYAAETRPYMYRVQQTQQLQELLNRGSVPVTYETVATTPQGQQVTRYTTRSTALTASRLGSIARSAVGGPAILAATAAYIAYDLIYDESTDTWQLPSDYDQLPVAELGAVPNVPQACAAVSPIPGVISGESGGFVTTYFIAPSTTPGVIGGGFSLVGSCTSLPAPYPRVYRRVTPVAEYPQPVPNLPASDSDLGDAVKFAPPQAVSDILNDPIQSGTWPDRWPELLPNVQDIEDQLGHDIEGAPAPANPDQTITDGSTVAPPQTDTGSGGSMSSEWPTFCSWAGVVCDFIDWVQEPFEEPEPVEVPYAEIDFEEDYDSGIGIPNCPAPISIVTQFGEVQFDWTNTCTLADMVRPLVIAFSYLIGIYILLRVK